MVRKTLEQRVFVVAVVRQSSGRRTNCRSNARSRCAGQNLRLLQRTVIPGVDFETFGARASEYMCVPLGTRVQYHLLHLASVRRVLIRYSSTVHVYTCTRYQAMANMYFATYIPRYIATGKESRGIPDARKSVCVRIFCQTLHQKRDLNE